MRIPVDKEFLERARAEGLPLFRIQIDWRFVPKEVRSLKAHENCGLMSLEKASELLRLSLSDWLLDHGLPIQPPSHEVPTPQPTEEQHGMDR